MSTFDDLVDDFLNPKDKSDHEKAQDIMAELSQITDEKELNRRVFQRFGEPTQVVKVIENGIEVIQCIWKRPEGTFFTTYTNDIEGSNDDNLDKIWENIYNSIRETGGKIVSNYTGRPVDLSEDLNKQLEDAVASEDYVLAAQLRDRINAKKNEQPK